MNKKSPFNERYGVLLLLLVVLLLPFIFLEVLVAVVGTILRIGQHTITLKEMKPEDNKDGEFDRVNFLKKVEIN